MPLRGGDCRVKDKGRFGALTTPRGAGPERAHSDFPPMLKNLDLRRRAIASGLHLLISAVVAAFAAWLVFGVWYPGSFRHMAGGRDLFVLVISVDIVIGPLLTFAVFNVAKGRRQLGRDLAVIGLLQFAALSYGLYTVYAARPVAMVFEVDRFRLVTASDVAAEELPKARPEYRDLSMAGPLLLGTRRPEAGPEREDAMFKGLAGLDIGSRPLFWQPYELSRAQALARGRPIGYLLEHHPEGATETRERLAAMHADLATARFLPVIARAPAVAVIDGSGVLLGYLPLDGFL